MALGTNETVGVAIRVGPGEDVQLIVQDALGALTSLEAYALGHVVVP